MHTHVLAWKVDLDIAGTHNSLNMLNFKVSLRALCELPESEEYRPAGKRILNPCPIPPAHPPLSCFTELRTPPPTITAPLPPPS